MKNFNMETMLKNITKEIRVKGLKQKDIANMMYLSESEVSRILNGKREMSIKDLFNLERILQVDVHYFVYGDCAGNSAVDKAELFKVLVRFRELYQLMSDICKKC